MLDKSTCFAFPIHPYCFLFHPFCFPKIPFLHIVIKVQAQIRESNEQGCIATLQRVSGSLPKMTAAAELKRHSLL